MGSEAFTVYRVRIVNLREKLLHVIGTYSVDTRIVVVKIETLKMAHRNSLRMQRCRDSFRCLGLNFGRNDQCVRRIKLLESLRGAHSDQ